jgi:ferrochelatase
LEEIDIQNRAVFEQCGGQRYRYIPCLNDREDHIEALASVVEQKMTDWLVPLSDWDADLAERLASQSRERASAMQRAGVQESSEPG